MSRCPIISADVAELLTTATGHMVAPLILLNNELTFFALPIVQITLEKLDLLNIALTLMHCQKAFPTANVFAGAADHDVLSGCFENALAVFFRTHLEVWVL
jgi:hypothetical protein